MGIRLACPNGHQLHVKTFLAGKRGICPKCGAKFIIPSAANGGAAGLAGPGSSMMIVWSQAVEPITPEAAKPCDPTSEMAPPGPTATPSPPAGAASDDQALPPAQAASTPPRALSETAVEPLPPFVSAPSADPAPALPYRVHRRRNDQTQLVVAIVLLAAVIVLAGLLIWVVGRNKGQASAARHEPRGHLAQICPPPYVAQARRGKRCQEPFFTASASCSS